MRGSELVDELAAATAGAVPPPGPAPSAPTVAWPRRAYAWYVVGVLVVAYGFAILDRIAIGLLVDPIKADLHVTDAEMGLLQGLAFALCYTTFGLPIGYLIDRWRRRPLLALGIALWSAATAACGLAKGFGGLFLARVGVGIGEATITPGAGSLISDYFPPERRGRAYSVFMLGSSLGTAFSYLFTALAIYVSDIVQLGGSGWLAGLHKWQITFFLIGLPGLAIALLFVLTVREPVRRGVASPIAAGFPLRRIWTVLSSNAKAYVAIMGGGVLNITAVYVSLAWQPSLFVRVHHWTPQRIGLSLAVVSLVIGMSGALIVGWTMDWLVKRGRKDAPVLMMMGHSISIVLFNTAAALAPRPELTLVFIACSALASTWTYAAALTALNQISPNEMRGQITAVFTLGTGLVSMSIGTFLVGFLNDTVFTAPTGIAYSMACVYAGSGLLAATALLLARKGYQVALERAQLWQEKV